MEIRSSLYRIVAYALAATALFSVSRERLQAQIPASEYTARRDSLAARIGDGVVVAFGGRTPVTDFGPFYQIPAFHYLTNFDEPDAAMVLVAKGGKATTTFFLSPIDPRTAFYYGRRPDSTSVERTLGVKARAFSAIGAFVDSLASLSPAPTFYTLADFGDADFARQDSLTRGREGGAEEEAEPGIDGHVGGVEGADGGPRKLRPRRE